MDKIFDIIIHQLDIIEKKTYDKLCSVGSHFCILYGLAKFHKQLVNNQCTHIWVFIWHYEPNPSLFMAILDIDSLFTNIPLCETINIIIEKLLSKNETVHSLNKDQFRCLLTLATKEFYFLFNRELYQQVDGITMGSPLEV